MPPGRHPETLKNAVATDREGEREGAERGRRPVSVAGFAGTISRLAHLRGHPDRGRRALS